MKVNTGIQKRSSTKTVQKIGRLCHTVTTTRRHVTIISATALAQEKHGNEASNATTDKRNVTTQTENYLRITRRSRNLRQQKPNKNNISTSLLQQEFTAKERNDFT